MNEESDFEILQSEMWKKIFPMLIETAKEINFDYEVVQEDPLSNNRESYKGKKTRSLELKERLEDNIKKFNKLRANMS